MVARERVSGDASVTVPRPISHSIPSLSSSEMLGKAVIAFVDRGRPWKDKEGKTRQFWDCKFCKSWKDGKDKKVGEGNDAIPF